MGRKRKDAPDTRTAIDFKKVSCKTCVYYIQEEGAGYCALLDLYTYVREDGKCINYTRDEY